MAETQLRIGLFGLGMMGRHHARVLASLEDVEFVGAYDPAGDRHGAVNDAPVMPDADSLLDLELDAAVVAVPTAHHADMALQLADRGVHALIEKPLAVSVDLAERVRETFDSLGLIGVVGHIERYNPALQAMHARLVSGELGRIISVLTERVGPFPNRIQDVGVVKDLATHDLDLAMWLGNATFKSIHAETAHKTGRPYEDLVSIVGRLTSGAVVTSIVNWLTPTKRRQVTVLGERGALVADLLAADLYFFANADVTAEWDAMARMTGVSEGDMVRYALHKPEPLLSELQAFVNAVRTHSTDGMVTLAQGVEIVRLAQRVVDSSAEGRVQA